MYIPKHFQVDDMHVLASFIQQHSFGTLFSQTDGEPFATHLPFLLEQDEGGQRWLLGHMAKANPHWTLIDGGSQVLVVFQGPHAYISPTWYKEEQVVPTWNYISVHVYGEFGLIEKSERVVALLNRSVKEYEASMDLPWHTDLDNDFNRQLIHHIVGVSIKVNRIEGKWKLSQNHSAERRKRVIEGLRSKRDSQSSQIADLMEFESAVTLNQFTIAEGRDSG